MAATTNEIENKMLFGLTLHLVLFNVKTKVRNYFLNLIRKHFPPPHKFIKLFNRNPIKVSYSCMPNIKAKIHKHNKSTLEKSQQNIEIASSATVQIKKQCPLNVQCLTESIAYRANIPANLPGYKEKVYHGVSETTFEVRYSNHKNRLQNNLIKAIRNYPRSAGK